jgi:hypothetical protein
MAERDTFVGTWMLLLRGGEPSSETLSPDEIQAMIQPYIDWSNRLRAEGRHVGGDELADGGRTVRMNGDSVVVDGPFTETKEAIGGYFLIRASSDEDAADVASGCPILRNGGFVEVRRIVDHAG